jgi:Amt family ammonium transporter
VQTLGVLMLWFGWYGFNACSTLAIVGYAEVAAKIMVTTTLSAVTGAMSLFFIGSGIDTLREGKPVLKLEYINSGVLAGLVGITAGCSVVEPWAAIVIGFCTAPIFYCSSKLVKACGIDDGESTDPPRAPPPSKDRIGSTPPPPQSQQLALRPLSLKPD